jgi:hypothetical protein
LPDVFGVAGARALRNGPITRLRSCIRGASLDRALAAGANPCESAALARRAAHLSSRRSRRRIAAWVSDTVNAAHQLRRGLSAAITPDRDEVLGAAEQLMRVEELLESSGPVYARGVAMLKALLSDGASSLYSPRRAGELRRDLDSIISALEGHAPGKRNAS